MTPERVPYGFSGRLKAEFPSQIIVDITEVCNLACIHCPHPVFKQSNYYGGRFLDPELNKKLVDEVREKGQGFTEFLRYTSDGEPLAHPNGYEMVAYAAENSGVYVTLTTNGTLMDERRTLQFLHAGVHMIDVSMDALEPDTYARIRVNGKLEVTRGNVLRLMEWIRRDNLKTKVVVSFVEQPQNKGEADGFEKFWKEQGADFVIIRRLHSAAGAVPAIAETMRAKNATVERRPCVYPWERIVLNPRGLLSFCPADWTHGSTVTDFRDHTVEEIWQGEFYAALRKAHLTNEYSYHSFCGQCPDWSSIRWPFEARAYADMVEDFIREGRETQ